MKIRVHPLFVILLIVAGWAGSGRFFFLSFVSVLLHEMAHAAVAWAFSYQTRRIVLYPFGGVALIDAALMGDAPAEGLTAAAGPAQSFFLAGLALLCSEWLGGGALWTELFQINLGLALFNLFPLYPLDGGRILRAALLPSLGLRKAGRFVTLLTRVAAGIAILPAAFLVYRGICPWIIPVLLALLIWASKDPRDYFYLRWRQGERRRQKLSDGAMLGVRLGIVNQRTAVGEVGDELEDNAYHIILTADKNGQVAGWVDEAVLWKALMDGRYTETIEVMARHVPLGKKGVQTGDVETKENPGFFRHTK